MSRGTLWHDQAMLSQDQLDRYNRDGFLVCEGFVSRETCAALRARAAALIDAFDPGQVRTVFSTRDQSHARDDYFLSSGGEVRCFLEADALGPDGGLRCDKALAINKIGHALHDLDPVFAPFSRAPALRALAADLGLAAPLLLQSMYIFKSPGTGGEVTCHQDATYLYTEPLSVVGLWFALADATRENGCLWAIPGGHRGGLKSRFRRDAPGQAQRMITQVLDPTPWPLEQMVPLEVQEGALVLLHGLLPHMSHENRSPRPRPAYALHLIDGACSYPADNWLRRPDGMPARGF